MENLHHKSLSNSSRCRGESERYGWGGGVGMWGWVSDSGSVHLCGDPVITGCFTCLMGLFHTSFWKRAVRENVFRGVGGGASIKAEKVIG